MGQQMSPADYANLPLAESPTGVYNFTNPETRSYQMYIGMGVCMVVAFIFVSLRFYVKAFVNRTWGWEDRTLT